MQSRVHPIAKITKTSGLDGKVRLRPLSRYFDDHINNPSLTLGDSQEQSEAIKLEFISGIGKKRSFKFCGVNTINDALKIVGKILFAQADADDGINLISKALVGYDVVTLEGKNVGVLKDVMWLPSNDVYVITKNNLEYLIPIIPEVIKNIDYQLRTIIISPMDGLLD
tara:strand:- start:3588 stop:4091 length:504 start_codon:yes stop_codon:yes gene_type:complete